MNHDERQARLSTERERIRAAIDRLRTGTPERSDGRCTVVTLATEAQVPRHRLYEHHADLLAELTTAVAAGPPTPLTAALQEQLRQARERVHTLEADNALLAARLRALTAVITEMTLELRTDNVTSLGCTIPPDSGRRGR